MRTTKLLPILVVLTWLAGTIVLPVAAAPPAQGGNLLQNPSWEAGSQGGWDWWHYEIMVPSDEDKKVMDKNKSFYSPDFMPSESKWDKEGGNQAGEVSGFQYTKFRAGFLQKVNVAAGARVRFSVWVNGYCADASGGSCPVILRAGIDSNGGTDWQSGSIQWVDTQTETNNPKKYIQLVVPEVTVGPSGSVTVFTWGEPTYPLIYTAAYFDEASLVITAASPATTPTQAAAAPQPTQAPQPVAQAPAACASLHWVSDVTVPDGTVMAPGQQFTKTWRVRNSGSCAFSGTLNFIGSGNKMGGQSPAVLPKIDAGQQGDVSISLTAPAQPGDYQGTWQPRLSDGTAMENLIVKITVSANAAPVAGVTATPQGQAPPQPTASPTPTTGQICVQAFNDRNGDGQQDTDENLLAGVVFTLSDTNGPKDSYTADGVSEPYCFADLQPGSYTLSMKAPQNYTATTNKSMIIALNGGMKTDVSFGARRGGPAATPTRTGGSSGTSLLGSAGRVILIVVAILVLIGLGFVGGFILMTRRP
jgi:hypothetical protein